MSEEMNEKRSIRGYISLGGKGALIGVANTVPGVSGGTIAVVTGIYDELMDSIAHFVKSWKFLLVLFGGAAVGILAFAHLIEFLFANYSHGTLYSFMGLIIGGVPFLWKKADFSNDRSLSHRAAWAGAFFVSLVLIILMGRGLEPGETAPMTNVSVKTLTLIFLGGAAGAAAMIIPGVSGSFLLLLLGLYTTFIRAVNDMNIPLLAAAGLGMAAGILLVARLMSFCLHRFPRGTYAAILGLVVGSLVTLWPGFLSGAAGLVSLIFIPLGILGGYFLGDRG